MPSHYESRRRRAQNMTQNIRQAFSRMTNNAHLNGSISIEFQKLTTPLGDSKTAIWDIKLAACLTSIVLSEFAITSQDSHSLLQRQWIGTCQDVQRNVKFNRSNITNVCACAFCFLAPSGRLFKWKLLINWNLMCLIGIRSATAFSSEKIRLKCDTNKSAE